MAEHVFESDIVEEFYNSCHGPNGRFCSAGAKGKGIKRVPMSSAARASNAAIRGKAAKARKKAAAKQEQSKGAMAKMSGQAKKVKVKENYGSGKTEPGALKLTQKYGTRGAGRGAQATAKPGSASKKSGGTSGSKYKPDNAGSGKTAPDALRMTSRFGTRGARPTVKGKSASAQSGGTSGSKYKKDDAGSGKTESRALSLTERFGGRRRG